VQQRLPSLLNPPLAFGHRGAKSLAQDNTLESFELALKLGANGLETDAWITADGVVVLDHDGVVRRRARSRSIASLPLEAMPPHIPSLTDLFQRCGIEFDLSIDVKDAHAFGSIMEAVDSAGFSRARLWLCHPDVSVLTAVRESFAQVRLVNSVRLQKIKEGPERRCALLAETGIDAINMHHTDWNGGLVTMAHKFGLVAFGWDAQFDHVLTDGLRMGLDGLYSDFVDRLVDAYRLQIGHVPRR
jgi:glycerophosphoryl diester phosphodiesterase